MIFNHSLASIVVMSCTNTIDDMVSQESCHTIAIANDLKIHFLSSPVVGSEIAPRSSTSTPTQSCVIYNMFEVFITALQCHVLCPVHNAACHTHHISIL